MLKQRLLLVWISALVIWALFQLPKAVVDNENVETSATDSVSSHIESHAPVSENIRSRIQSFRTQFTADSGNEKNAIFADSLAKLYRLASQFDSAGWFAEEAAKFFNTTENWVKAGDDYYQAYTLALDRSKQGVLAAKVQEIFGKVLRDDSGNLEVKTKMAMTYLTSESPMQGITMLR
ncbi:MAG: peptidase, partial [Bacteroidota bacterium]